MKCDINIVMVKVGAKLAATDQGEILEITKFLDEMGDQTDDPDEYRTAIVKHRENCWHVVWLDEFTEFAH